MGVRLSHASNTVGRATTVPGSPPGNVISFNGLAGVMLGLQSGPTGGGGADNNIIMGNIIGLNATGTAALGNGTHGVWSLTGGDGTVSNTTIGGTTAAERNVISGNASDGVSMNNASGTVIQSNYIGTDVTGTVDLGNGRYGVFPDKYATVGGITLTP